jgi:hypothetical protein
MRFTFSRSLFLLLAGEQAAAFSLSSLERSVSRASAPVPLYSTVGLGPQKKEEEERKELVPGVDYEVPDHESYRTSRRSKIDEQCDQWFGSLLGDDSNNGILKSLAEDHRKVLATPVPLVNDVRYGYAYDYDDLLMLMWRTGPTLSIYH